MKKFLCFILSAVLLLSLSACQKPGESEQSTSEKADVFTENNEELSAEITTTVEQATEEKDIGKEILLNGELEILSGYLLV